MRAGTLPTPGGAPLQDNEGWEAGGPAGRQLCEQVTKEDLSGASRGGQAPPQFVARRAPVRSASPVGS